MGTSGESQTLPAAPCSGQSPAGPTPVETHRRKEEQRRKIAPCSGQSPTGPTPVEIHTHTGGKRNKDERQCVL